MYHRFSPESASLIEQTVEENSVERFSAVVALHQGLHGGFSAVSELRRAEVGQNYSDTYSAGEKEAFISRSRRRGVLT